MAGFRTDLQMGKRKLEGSIAHRDMLLNFLGVVQLVGNDRWSLKHCVNLMAQRGELDRMEELVQVYREAFPYQRALSVWEFYHWYRHSSLTKTDLLVCDFYCGVVSQWGITEVDISVFSCRGEALLKKLREWAGPCGNSDQSLLQEFFVAAIASALSFNQAILSKPKSLLEQFGWNAFIEHIENEYGNKDNFLLPTAQEMEEAKATQALLLDLNEVRRTLLASGDLKGYDEIGKMIAAQGVVETHSIFCAEHG